jgi:hypothetical protein
MVEQVEILVKYSKAMRDYPEWLRQRVVPPQGDSMPLFLPFSTPAYLLNVVVVEDGFTGISSSVDTHSAGGDFFAVTSVRM